MTTLVSEYGRSDQKGTVLGIYRSLGALARALGPIAASIGKRMKFFKCKNGTKIKIEFFFSKLAFWSFGSSTTYILGGLLLLCPAVMLQKLQLVQL